MSLSSLPDPNPILDLIDAFRRSKAMFSAVSLGVFDSLDREPLTLVTLAAKLQCQSEPLERLLNACVGLNLLAHRGDTYANTATASAYLTRSSPNTLAGYILYSDQVLFKLWAHLENAVRLGTPQWSEAFGKDGGIFDHFFRTDEAMQTFLKGMHGLGLLSSPSVVSAFDLSRYRQLIDLGGATGHLAIAACKLYPEMEAVVFDLPRVIDAVRDQPLESAVASRIRFMKGNFFQPEEIPRGDLFGLSRILHDWPDEKVLPLLRSIHDHLEPGGGILVSEKLLAEDRGGPTPAHLQSLNMLVCTEGKERTLSEFRALLQAAGFNDVKGRVTGATLDAVFATKPDN
jgi:acetylserotonin O-methyltransferase